MGEEILAAELAAEARDENTPPARLEHLMRYAELHPLLAANSATPPRALEQLSLDRDRAVRAAVALNPNTSLRVLGKLAVEFPAEFLRNPLIPVLDMTQPDFVKKLPAEAWPSLLRFASLSPVWFQQLKAERTFQRWQTTTWELLQLHVSQVDEAMAKGQLKAKDVRRTYQARPPVTVTPPAQESAELFLRFVLLFPYTAPALKKQWLAAAQELPHKTGLALSLLPNMGSQTLRLLAQNPHPELLTQVARHPATRPRTLKHLARAYQRPQTAAEAHAPAALRALASNSHTPLEAMYLLLSAEDAHLRSRAVTHPALEALDREIMALDQAAEVRTVLATSRHLTPALFAQLASDPAPGPRAALARNLQTPVDLLSRLARDTEERVRAAAAGNPRLPVEAQAALLADAAASVRASLSGNARLKNEHATLLARDAAPAVRAALAANPRTPIPLLAPLLRAEEPEVWLGLARHPHLAPELLAQLALQGDLRTRVAVAAHTRTPVATLAELAREYPPAKGTYELWCALASNPQTPLTVLEQAIHTTSLELLYRLLHHPAMLRAKRRPFLTPLSEQIQEFIARDQVPAWLRQVFLQYTAALPVEIVAPFALSPHWEERYLLACRPYLPEPLLATLAQDGIRHVQTAAREMLERRQKR